MAVDGSPEPLRKVGQNAYIYCIVSRFDINAKLRITPDQDGVFEAGTVPKGTANKIRSDVGAVPKELAKGE